MLLPEYRGFGKSEGVPSESAMLADAEVALGFLRSRFDVNNIVVYGRSLGMVSWSIRPFVNVRLKSELMSIRSDAVA